MEKQIYNLTSGFLRMNRLLLFVFIAFPLTIKFYSPPSDDYVMFNRLITGIGGICLLGWLFAIGHKANEKLVSQGIILKSFKIFNWSVLSVIISFILILFFATDINTTLNGVMVHYYSPMFLLIISGVCFLITMLIAAKSLVSAEINKDADVGEYFTTLLLMMFAAIGLWFIQPRVQKI